MPAEPVVRLPECLVHRLHESIHRGCVRDGDQPYAFREGHLEVQVVDRGNHEGLLGAGHEPGSAKPVREVGRLVIGVVLPLPLTSARREPCDLGSDDRVGVGLVEPAPHHPVPGIAVGDHADHRPVVLDPDGWLGHRGAPDLLVEGGQHSGYVHGPQCSTSGGAPPPAWPAVDPSKYLRRSARCR